MTVKAGWLLWTKHTVIDSVSAELVINVAVYIVQLLLEHYDL